MVSDATGLAFQYCSSAASLPGLGSVGLGIWVAVRSRAEHRWPEHLSGSLVVGVGSSASASPRSLDGLASQRFLLLAWLATWRLDANAWAALRSEIGHRGPKRLSLVAWALLRW